MPEVQEKFKLPSKYLRIPIIILTIAVGSTAYVLGYQSTLVEHSPDIIKMLAYVIGVIGSCLLAMLVFMFKTFFANIKEFHKKSDANFLRLTESIYAINVRCAAYGHLTDEQLKQSLERVLESGSGQ